MKNIVFLLRTLSFAGIKQMNIRIPDTFPNIIILGSNAFDTCNIYMGSVIRHESGTICIIYLQI